VIVARSDGFASTAVSAGSVVLVPVKMGSFTVYASTVALSAANAAKIPCLDASTMFARAPKIVDFSGYYLCGTGNPAFKQGAASAVGPVDWDAGRNEFFPSTADDWRPWPWLPGVDPALLLLHTGKTTMALVTGEGEEHFTAWAVGRWARGDRRLRIGARPLTDPLVLLCCQAPVQEVADEVGHLVYGPDGGTTIGAQPLSMTDKSAGVMVNVTLHPGGDGRAGQFRSAWPQGRAGDVVRWAYRERFKGGEVSWIAERFAPPGAAPPRGVRPRVMRGGGRLSGWCYFDERDWSSRRAALTPASVGPVFVTWAPNDAYRPGAPRDLDPGTGKITGAAEPWHVTGQAALPFDARNVVFVAGCFAWGQFVVTDPSNLSYLESPQDFGVRLNRDYQAAEMGRGGALPRTVVLLTDNEPVPAQAAALVARGLGDIDIITASMPATMFLDDQPAAGIPQTRVALVPGRGDTAAPVWIRTGAAGTAALTASVSPGSRPGRAQRSMPDPVPLGTPQADRSRARPQDLAHVRAGLEAGTGLTPDVPVPVLTAASPAVSVGAVRSPVSVNFSADLSPGEWPLGISYPLQDRSFEVAEVNAGYDPGTLAGGTGPWPLAAWPMLITGQAALPAGAARDPLYVFADYYGGYFLLPARPAAGGAVSTHAETPAGFGRRIKAEITRAQAGRGPGPASKRPVVLLAKHRPVPPPVAAALARELLDAGGDVYTASMPASVYVRGTGRGAVLTLALIRLPGHADQPYWTRSTPLGQSTRIDIPTAHQKPGSHGAPGSDGQNKPAPLTPSPDRPATSQASTQASAQTRGRRLPRRFAAARAALIRDLGVPHPQGASTPAGYVFLARGAPGVADDTKDHVDAAFSFLPVAGATVLHLHTTDGGTRFAVDDQVLTPAEFCERKLALLNLPRGKPVIIVACNGIVAAPELARLLGAPVVAANMNAYTLPDRRVVSARPGITPGPGKRPRLEEGDWILVRDGQPLVRLGAYLLAAIHSGKLAGRLGTFLAIREDGAWFRPPRRPVRWAGSGGTTKLPPQTGPSLPDPRSILERFRAPEVMRPLDIAPPEGHAPRSLLGDGPYQPNHAQYRMLVARNLKLRKGQPDFFQTLIDGAGPEYLTAVLRSQNVNDPVTPQVIRRFLAARFADEYGTDTSGPQRFDPYLVSDDGTPMSRDEAIMHMSNEAVFSTMMAAVTPRLAADHLGLNISILNQSGTFEELSPIAYGDHPVLLMTTGSNQDPLVELVPGVPAAPDAAVPSEPLWSVVPDVQPTGPQRTPGLTALTEAATTLGEARTVADAVNGVRLQASQARDLASGALMRDETHLFHSDLADYRRSLREARMIADAMHEAERSAATAAEAQDARVRGAVATLPPWLFGTQAAEQERNWEAVDIAAEVAWSAALVQAADRAIEAARGTPEIQPVPADGETLGSWTRAELARRSGQLAYLRYVRKAATSRQTAAAASDAGQNAARRVEAAPPEYERAAAVLSTEELDEIHAAANAARTLPPDRRGGIEDDDEASAFFARTAEHQIRQRLARQAKQRVERSLPVTVGVQLDRFEAAETARRQAEADDTGVGAAPQVRAVKLAVGQEQHRMSWGEWGQIARIGGQWLGNDEHIADQAAAGFRDGSAKEAVRSAVVKLFKDHGSRRAGRTLASGLVTPLPGSGPARFARLRLVLGRLRGPDGASYVPAYEVEQDMQIGVRPYNPTDTTHYNLGGTSSGFSNARSATLPFTEPSLALPSQVLGLVSTGPSVVLGGGRGFSRSEGNSASADRQLVHSSGLAYFDVPAVGGDVRAGSHWEITLLDATGTVLPLKPRSEARQLLAESDGSIGDFTDGADLAAEPVASGSHARPTDVLLSFPLDEAPPVGQTAPRPLGEQRPATAEETAAPIRLPAGATDEQAEEFHRAYLEVFAPVQGIVPPAELTAKISESFRQDDLPRPQPVRKGKAGRLKWLVADSKAALRAKDMAHRVSAKAASSLAGRAWKRLPRLRFGFPRVGPRPAQGVAEELREHNLHNRQYAWLTSGMLSPEWDPEGDGASWARMRLTGRITSVQRVGGSRDAYVQQDARHLQSAEGASKTISSNVAAFYDSTLHVPTGRFKKLAATLFPWVGITSGSSRTQSGLLGSGDWRYKGYVTDEVTYAADVTVTADVESSVASARGKKVGAGTMYFNVPVAEVPRLEARLRRVATIAAETAAARAGHPGDAKAQANARMRAEASVPEVISDGPLVKDRELPASIRAGRSRGPGIIDLLPGAKEIIPKVMEALRAAENGKLWHQRKATQRMTERDWMHVEAALGRLISAEALIPLSSLLVNGGVQVTLGKHRPGSVERTTITVKWAQDKPEADGDWGNGTPPVVTRLPHVRIDHYPVGYTAASMNDALISGVYAGWAPTASYKSPDTKGNGLSTFGAGGGYSLSRSATGATTVGTGAWASHGWVYNGPALQATMSGNFVVSIRVDDVPDPVSAGSVPWIVWFLSKYAFKWVRAQLTRGEKPEWTRVTPLYRPEPLEIPGKLRTTFPESLAPPAGTPQRDVTVQRSKPEVINKGSWWPRLLVKKTRRADPPDPRFTAAVLGTPGELGQEDLTAGLPGIEHIRQTIEDLAATGEIPPEQCGDVLDKLFNEDQVVGRLQYGGKKLAVTFDLSRQGFVTDRLAAVTVVFSFYDMQPTGQKVLLEKTDMADAEPNLTYVKSRTHAHGFTVLLGRFQGGKAPAAVIDGGPGLTGNLRTKTGSMSRDVTWLDGHWNTHPLREFAVHDARVVADVQVHVWKENAAGRLVPTLYRQQVKLEHAIDVYRPAPRPRWLPPPGVPQRLPASRLPLLSNTDQLKWHGAPKDGLNALQQKILQVIRKLDSSAVSDRWVIVRHDGQNEARLVPAGLPGHVTAVTDDVSLLALMPVLEGPQGVMIQQLDSKIGRSTRLHLVVRAEQDPANAGYLYSDSADDAGLGNYQVSIDRRTLSMGRVRKPVPGVRGESELTGPVGKDRTVPTLSGGPDEWNKNLVETWTRSRNAVHSVHVWLRDVLTIAGVHYYKGRVRFVVAAYQVTSPSLPVSELLLGLPTDLELALRGPTDLSRPDAMDHTDAIARRMMPKKSVPPAGEPLPPAPAWKYAGPTAGLDLDAILAVEGLQKLLVTETDLLSRNAYLVGLHSGSLRGAHGHAQMTLTGGIVSGSGKKTRPSRLIGRLLTFGGGGPAWFATIFSPAVMKRYAPRMVGRDGYSFPRLVRDIGWLTGKGDATVKLAFYDAMAGVWHEAALAGETVHQVEDQTGSSSGKALTETASLDPAVAVLGGRLAFTGLPSAVLSQSSSYGDSGGAKTIRSGAFRRRVTYQEVLSGVLIVVEMRASKYAGRFKLPSSLGKRVPLAWGNPVAEYLAGGKARLAYRLDNSGSLLLDPETSMRLRVLPPDGIPLPNSRIFPLISRSPNRDIDRVRAASSLAGHGAWHPLFLHYDPVTDRVRMTVSEEPAGGGPQKPMERELDVDQAADLIRSIHGSAGHPIVLITEGAARLGSGDADSFATRLGRLLSVDIIATPDKVLQDNGRTLAARFEVDSAGNPIAGTIRRGNWMLLPADGSGPLLLGDDLDRAFEVEVPARLQAPAKPHALGVAKPARPVAWTAPAPAPGLAPAVPPGPAPLGSLPDLQPAGRQQVALGAGVVATAFRGTNGSHSVVVHSRDADLADWTSGPDALLDLPGYVTVAIPEHYCKQDKVTRALDTLIGGGAVPPGQGVLLVMSGAAGAGPGSFAHRLAQRYQNPAGSGPATGPAIIAPGGMVVRLGATADPDADLLTYHEDDDPARWWRFSPNDDPLPLYRFLSRTTNLTPTEPAKIWMPVKSGDGLQARPLPAGWHLTADAPLTEERYLELEAIPWTPQTRRIVIDAEHYGDGSLLAGFLDWLQQNDHTVEESPWHGTLVELQSGDPASLAQLRRGQGLPALSREYLRSEAIRHGIPFLVPAPLVVDSAVRWTHAFAPGLPHGAGTGTNIFATMPPRPYTRLEIPTADTVAAAGGVPNGTSQRQEAGYPVVWQLNDQGMGQWRPFAQYLSHRPWEGELPPGAPVVTGVLPTSLWLRNGHQLVADPDVPETFAFGPDGPGAEVVAAGLWIRPGDAGFSAAGSAAIRSAPPSPHGPVITIGMPGHRVSEAEWELAHHVVAHLLPQTGSQRQRSWQVRTFLHIAGNIEPATSVRVSRLAATGNVIWLGTNIVAAQYAKADTGQRVTQVGPLPVHHVPDQPDRPARMGAPPRQNGPQALDHGIPYGSVAVPRPPGARGGRARDGELAQTFDLGAEVVVNPWPFDTAYIIMRHEELEKDNRPYGWLRSDRWRFALPSRGFFPAEVRFQNEVWKNPPSGRLRQGDVMLKVSIPPGAAILPLATRDARRAGIEGEVWLPPNALARVLVTKAYTIDARGRRWSSVLRRDLASLMAGAAGEPIDAGWLFHSRGHIAADREYQQARRNLEDQHKESKARRATAQHLSDAEASAKAAEAARDAAADETRVAHHIGGQAGETTLVFSTEPATGTPVLNGRPVTPEEFAREIAVLVAKHPKLDQPVFRLAGTVGFDYVKQLAFITGRSFIAADSPVYFAAAGLLDGTMVATSIPAGQTAPAMPPTGRWYLFTPNARPRRLSIARPGPSLDKDDADRSSLGAAPGPGDARSFAPGLGGGTDQADRNSPFMPEFSWLARVIQDSS
jgi:hypothetical protein